MAGAIGSEEKAERNIREAARAGRLAEYMETATVNEKAALYRIVASPVYERLTRAIEKRRGHPGCAGSVHRLEPDCHDRYQDDVAAVLDDLLRNGTGRIGNIEGWIVPRLKPVTIDAHRRRRGERGAQQRPRLPLPIWLADGLRHDPWLEVLAIEILTWVGMTATAGVAVWPLVAWGDRRAAFTGEPAGAGADIAADVERVLAAMRTNRIWYDKFVERPLGRKQPPVLPARRGDSDRDPAHLALVGPDDVRDARLRDLAATAVAAIETRVARGADVRTVVVDVLGVVFGAGTGAEEMDSAPDPAPTPEERAAAMIGDPATVERIIAVVLDILAAR